VWLFSSERGEDFDLHFDPTAALAPPDDEAVADDNVAFFLALPKKLRIYP
jgi:hypothetical protein